MSRAEQILTLIGSAGAALAAVVYTGRQIRRLAARIEDVLALPGAYQELRTVTANNTAAIKRLTEAVDRLERTESGR